jgi:hypothetical protein
MFSHEHTLYTKQDDIKYKLCAVATSNSIFTLRLLLGWLPVLSNSQVHQWQRSSC